MAAHGSFIANMSSALRERFARAFPGIALNTKHDYGRDYGWPEQLTFEHFYRMFCRSGLAASAIEKTITKTWATMPAIWESEQPAESEAEAKIRKHFMRRKIWRALMEADKRSMVGCYAGAILILRDGLRLDEPVVRVTGGIESLVSVIPAWEGQLTVVEWDQNPSSDTYGDPLVFQFNEQAVGETQNAAKSQVRIHRDRVLIWSDDGTVNCRSALEPGFNDLIDAEKVKGAGGEGFWKSSRGAPIIEAPKGLSSGDILKGMQASSVAEGMEKLNEQVDDFASGFDKALMLGGFSVSPLQISLPQPKEFWEPCVQSFAASLSIPFKVLVGNVTGERASTEDGREWSETNMSRRENRVLPILYDLLERLVAWGVLERKDWFVGWDSLLEASPDDKLNRAKIMADINSALPDEPAFMSDEIRDAAGFKPADEVEGFAEFMEDREERARQQAEDAPVEVIPGDEVQQ